MLRQQFATHSAKPAQALLDGLDRVSHALTLGALPRAEKELNLLIAQYPQRADLYRMRATTQAAQLRFDDALSSLESALEIDPNAAALWVCRGDILRATGALGEARIAYETATGRDPRYGAGWGKLAALDLEEGRVESALTRQTRCAGAEAPDPTTCALIQQAAQRKGLTLLAQVWREIGAFAVGQACEPYAGGVFFLNEAQGRAEAAQKQDIGDCSSHVFYVPSKDPWSARGLPTLMPLTGDPYAFFQKQRAPLFPRRIGFDAGDAEQRQQAVRAALLLDEVGAMRRLRAARLLTHAQMLNPTRKPGERVRVFIHGARGRAEAAGANLANSFAALGCDTRVESPDPGGLLIEDDAFLAQYIQFAPHLAIDVDCLEPAHLHPQLPYAVWWRQPESPKDLAWARPAVCWAESGAQAAELIGRGARLAMARDDRVASLAMRTLDHLAPDYIPTEINESEGLMDPQIISRLQEAVTAHQNGRTADAERLYLEIIDRDPRQEDALHLLACVHDERGDQNSALILVERAIAVNGDNPHYHSTLGALRKETGDLSGAETACREALRLDPNLAEAQANLGIVLMATERETEALEPLNRAVSLNPALYGVYPYLVKLHDEAGRATLADLYKQFYNHAKPAHAQPLAMADGDTLFLNAQRAAEQARKGVRFQQNQAISAPRLCYYLGSPQDDAPETLIALQGAMLDFLVETRLRLPARIEFNLDSADERQLAIQAAMLVDGARMRRNERVQAVAAELKQLPPRNEAGLPRVMLAASRMTTVMQHASRNLAHAFEKLGCPVRFVIEQNELEGLDVSHWFREQREFQPDLVVNINHLNNEWLHPEVWNVSWWQDPMPQISAGKPLPWRERDLCYSAYPQFDVLLRETDAPNVERQDLCVDLQRFTFTTPREERRKIVFVGSSHCNFRNGGAEEAKLLAEVKQRFEVGDYYSRAEVEALAQRYNLPFMHVFDYLYPSVVRDTSVEWLCELAPELDYEVEVWGRFWEKNPIVAPYFKGELPYGEAVVAKYNEARYSFSPHPHMVKSQRLAELAACGVYPIINDDRANAEGPHWDDHILFYRNKAELKACFERTPQSDPYEIAEAYSYETFARRILARMGRDVG
ncbi:tetratricopeptide repeat protein [Magnetofaba australis]|uniref:Spore protein YkvP/CgeB glycosyl transferase-like domain-containing protein n=1 Tax=Magnetofaba australis IT-1 TaxID=1434232 RepID=A0A1Y2K3Z6_9PROT|nr:tetratricopeptide repeat protein [Magnetofaba australis]OSM03996.1 hypothetical protein MAIT1_03755 [Magnetofaba australis IT-1]